MRWLADLCYLAAGLVYGPVLLYQMWVQGKNRRGWMERFGAVRPRVGGARCVWIHAVSLGEVNATRSLVQALRCADPDLAVVLSATTDTGYARARELFPDLQVFRFPLDFSWVIGRVLARIRPALIILVELEVWYNLVTLAARRGVDVCVVNGRFSARSARRLRWVGPAVRPMFANLRWVAAQNAAIAERFVAAGVPGDRVEVVGSMKWDTATVSKRASGDRELVAALGIRAAEPLVVLGSSGPGEEALLLDVWAQLERRFHGIQLAIVPRKPERFREVARLLEKRGRVCVRRSEFPDGCLPPTNTTGVAVILGDTMGELRKFYSACDVVVIGRTLLPMGGSDPMEIAALGKPALVGPHTDNFRDAVDCLERAGALVVATSPPQLADLLATLLADPDRRAAMGRRAQQVVSEQQGATRRTVSRLQELLHPAPPANPPRPRHTPCPGSDSRLE